MGRTQSLVENAESLGGTVGRTVTGRELRESLGGTMGRTQSLVENSEGH